MKLRRAQVGDAAGITEIVNAVVRDTAVTFTAQLKDVVLFGDKIRAGQPFWVVVNEAGQVSGYATYAQFRSGDGYAHTMEHGLALAQEVQGRGLGRCLMQALESHARDNGVHVLVAGISGENPGSVTFHQKLGFEVVGHMPQVGCKFGRWMDLILMQKIL